MSVKQNINQAKEIRKILNLNRKWEEISDSQKERKLYDFLEIIFLEKQADLLDEEKVENYYEFVTEELEKEDLLVDAEVDSKLFCYLKKREELALKKQERIRFVTVHFTKCLFILELFSIKERCGKVIPYFTIQKDNPRFRREFVEFC